MHPFHTIAVMLYWNAKKNCLSIFLKKEGKSRWFIPPYTLFYEFLRNPELMNISGNLLEMSLLPEDVVKFDEIQFKINEIRSSELCYAQKTIL